MKQEKKEKKYGFISRCAYGAADIYGGRQAAATQRGIAGIYIILPTVLMLATFFFAKIFPMGKREFAVLKQENAYHLGNSRGAGER